MSQVDEVITLQIKPREIQVVSLQIPVEAVRSLEEVATSRDLSVDALLKFYIGQGLRMDAAKLFDDRLSGVLSPSYHAKIQEREDGSQVEHHVNVAITPESSSLSKVA
jgi:hypothetical protein